MFCELEVSFVLLMIVTILFFNKSPKRRNLTSTSKCMSYIHSEYCNSDYVSRNIDYYNGKLFISRFRFLIHLDLAINYYNGKT